MSQLQQQLLGAASDGIFEAAWAGIDDDQRFVLLLLALLGVIAVSIIVPCVLVTVLSGVHRRRHEMELKQDMLDRGMSAEEIGEVIKAAPVEDAASRWVEGWKQKKKCT